MSSRRVEILLAAALVLSVLGAGALAVSREDVYYGNHRKYDSAAEVTARKVFAVIPAYKEIAEENIEEDSALYYIKLAEANKIFKKAVGKFAEDEGYDLVCEVGSIEDAPDVTDEVKKVVKKLVEEDEE